MSRAFERLERTLAVALLRTAITSLGVWARLRA